MCLLETIEATHMKSHPHGYLNKDITIGHANLRLGMLMKPQPQRKNYWRLGNAESGR